MERRSPRSLYLIGEPSREPRAPERRSVLGASYFFFSFFFFNLTSGLAAYCSYADGMLSLVR